MARKRKELPLLEEVEIKDVAAEGKSIAKVNDMVIFIPYGAPGDIVDVKLDKKKSNYAEGHIERLVKPSDLRVEPFCEHFGVCGGCKWQHLPYDFQLQCKQQQVLDALQRIAKVTIPAISPIIGSVKTTHYRNKLEFTFSNKSWITYKELRSGVDIGNRDALGFHIPGAFDKVLDIKKCWLQDDISNDIRLFIRSFAIQEGLSFYDLRAQEGLLRTIVVRITHTGEIMLIVVFGQDNEPNIQKMMSAVGERFPQITSLQYVINLKANDTITDQEIIPYRGRAYIEEEMEGLKFRIGPKSFYQTNSSQAYELYKVVRRMAGLTGKELVYDLYTGTGTIANFIAKESRQVIGIEYVEEAIADARLNSAVNGIGNTLFYAGDMKDILTEEFIREHGNPDVMIVDPPRAGMHENVVKVLLSTEPRRVVYVSCNPATQARDLAILGSKYEVVEIQPVDMFPHTHHVENVVNLKLRD